MEILLGGKPDLSKLSVSELEALQRDARDAIQDRRTAAAEHIAAQLRSLCETEGVDPAEVVRLLQGKRKSVPKAKYRHPSDPSLTWSGRGRKPAWVNEALEAGKSLESLAIK